MNAHPITPPVAPSYTEETTETAPLHTPDFGVPLTVVLASYVTLFFLRPETLELTSTPATLALLCATIYSVVRVVAVATGRPKGSVAHKALIEADGYSIFLAAALLTGHALGPIFGVTAAFLALVLIIVINSKTK